MPLFRNVRSNGVEPAFYKPDQDTPAPYNGGYWEYAYTSSGAPFMFPARLSLTEVRNPASHEKQELSAELAGLFLSMLALEALFCSQEKLGLREETMELLIGRYQQLRRDGQEIASANGYGRPFYRLHN